MKIIYWSHRHTVLLSRLQPAYTLISARTGHHKPQDRKRYDTKWTDGIADAKGFALPLTGFNMSRRVEKVNRMFIQSLIDQFHCQFQPHYYLFFCFVFFQTLSSMCYFPDGPIMDIWKKWHVRSEGFQLNLFKLVSCRSNAWMTWEGLFTSCFSGRNVDVKTLIFPGCEKKPPKKQDIYQ